MGIGVKAEEAASDWWRVAREEKDGEKDNAEAQS